MQIQNIRPLLMMPSPRDIPDVVKWWPQIQHDKFVVKYKNQITAYTESKKFFLEHPEYTHIIVCPDDLEVTPEGVKQLLDDIRDFGYQTISGYCNIDESQPDTYAIQPLGTDMTPDHPNTTKGSWYMKDEKPILPLDKFLLQVAHVGFSCQIIERSLFEKVKWIGASGGGLHNFDWQFSKDCQKLDIPIFVDIRVKLWHRRTEQYSQAKAVKNRAYRTDGYSFLMKAIIL